MPLIIAIVAPITVARLRWGRHHVGRLRAIHDRSELGHELLLVDLCSADEISVAQDLGWQVARLQLLFKQLNFFQFLWLCQ